MTEIEDITMQCTAEDTPVGAPSPGRERFGSAERGNCRGADDSGFTPAEIIIGVILLAILSTSVVAQALELRQQAQDAAAQTTLRSAVAAARGAYSLTLPNGLNNFVAATDLSTTAFADDRAISSAAVVALSKQEPNIHFVNYFDQGTGTVSGETGRLQNMTPAATTVWVHMPRADVKIGSTAQTVPANPNGLSVGLLTQVEAKTQIRGGDLIRLGLVAASGSSFCAIIVSDSSNGSVSGIGFQSVAEDSTLKGFGADCGAADSTGGAVNQFKEMPGTAGTDPSLTRPLSVTTANPYGGNATKA